MAIKQVHYTQGTAEWLQWRDQLVTASQVACIFGENPYQTKRDLWFEKNGLAKQDHSDKAAIFRMGHETEADIRELFLKQTGVNMEPTCFERDEIFGASLDGYDKSVGILEAKLVGKEALAKIAQGELPRHHWIQVQAQLFVSDSDKAFYGAKAPKVKDGLIVEVGRDENFMLDLQSRVIAFWESLKGETPPLTAQDTLFITDQSERDLFALLEKLKARKDAIEEDYDKIAEQVKALATHPKVRCGNVSITESECSGNVDYSKIPALAGVDLDQYRKASRTFKTIRFGGKS